MCCPHHGHDIVHDECVQDCRFNNDDSYSYRCCNKYCSHGGTFIGQLSGTLCSGRCICPGEYAGTCCEEPTCSWKGHWCWPGNCNGYRSTENLASDCACSSGFYKESDSTSYTKCQLQSDNQPHLVTCKGAVENTRHEIVNSTSGYITSCNYERGAYIKIQPDKISFVLEAAFQVNITEKKPHRIEEYRFGLVNTQIELSKVNLAGSKSVKLAMDMHSKPICTHTFSDINPFSSLVLCRKEQKAFPLKNGEKLCIKFSAFGGGYLKTRDFSDRLSSAHSYKRTSREKDICFTYDNVAPEHCSVIGTCASRRGEPLTINARITDHPNITVTFTGWKDPIPPGGLSTQASGVKQFSVQLLPLVDLDKTTLVMKYPEITKQSKLPNETQTMLILPKEPALYAVLLETHDVAGNVKMARRFVLYDNSSYPKINHANVLRVTSGSAGTNYTWQINLGPICVNWTERYYNSYHINNNLLKSIKTDRNIMRQYDQTSGEMSISGTRNVDGITKFKYRWKVDNKTSFRTKSILDVIQQSFCENLPVRDGETYQFWITPEDVNGREISESIAVHIDSTVPSIQDVWLERDGHQQLFVHNSSDLSKMSLGFKAIDIHSGLHSIHWRLGTKKSSSDIGQGTVGVKRLDKHDKCTTVDCYCPNIGLCERNKYKVSLNSLIAKGTHRGQHNRNYFFTIIVTNNARLVNVERLDVLADDSPPVVGVLQEGPMGSPDVDYMSSDQIIVSWGGFIDHESGIHSYRIGLSVHCLSRSELETTEVYNESVSLKTTREKYTKFNISKTGHYFFSIMAYNNAMEPSEVVCSDGFTKDDSPPTFSNITVKHGKVIEILACNEENPWLILENLTRVSLYSTEKCKKRCRFIPTFPLLDFLPIGLASSNDTDIADDLCGRLPYYTDDWFVYIPSGKIDLFWHISDSESQIQRTDIGFSSDASETEKPDIEDYKQVHGHSRYLKHEDWKYHKHEAIGSGHPFYIVLKTVNKAALASTVAFGPVIIDETPPIYNKGIEVHIHSEKVYCTWTNSSFVDLEQQDPIATVLYRIGSGSKFYTPLLQIPDTSSCLVPNVTWCVHYPLKRLQKQDAEKGMLFFFELHVFNRAGHFTTARSDPFHLPSMYLPGHGMVLDLDIALENNDTDVDFVSPGSVLCTSWSGFWHHLNVSFEVGLGSRKQTDDVIRFVSVDALDHVYCFNHSPLVSFQKYYFSVRASCSAGTVITSSNGFAFVDATNITKTTNVHFLSSHSETENPRTITVSLNSSRQQVVIDNLKETGLYILETYFGRQTGADIDSVDVLWADIGSSTSGVYSRSFRPMRKTPEFLISSNLTVQGNVLTLKLLPSVIINTTVQPSTDKLKTVWSTDPKIQTFVTNYIVKLYEDRCHSASLDDHSCIRPLSTVSVEGTNNYHIFSDLHLIDNSFCRIGVTTCFQHVCLNESFSNRLGVQSSPPGTHAVEASIDHLSSPCLYFNIRWHSFDCLPVPSNTGILDAVYDWTVSEEENGVGALFDWEPLSSSRDDNNTDLLSAVSCKDIHVYFHTTLFACVRGMCQSGVRAMACSPVALPPANTYQSTDVYELDSKGAMIKELKELSSSRYVGNKLNLLQSQELNFCRQRTILAGLVLNSWQRYITWYLMKDKHAPMMSCDLDKDCVAQRESYDGYVEFHDVNLYVDTTYYICAFSNKTVFRRELFDETVEEVSMCGNGVLVDESAPVPGKVDVPYQVHGYLRSTKEMFLSWHGFHDRENETRTTYHSTIRNFEYAIGTSPGSDDVSPLSSVGYASSVFVNNLYLSNGDTYYATVKATDYVGLTTQSVSTPVTVDVTPPVAGTIVVGSFRHKKVIARRDFIVHWENFRDEESGISQFHVGVGTRPGADDVLPAQYCSDQYIDLSDATGLEDGVTYYVALKVVNHAGLVREVVSESFLVDSSPPNGGVVRDGNSSVETDIDFQNFTDSLSCYWMGFYDAQSGVKLYRVGLGTQPNHFDIEPLTGVALKKTHTWKRHFRSGIKYYVTVEVCNKAGLCSRRNSDGIILDTSPPIPGRVHVGISSRHEKYQSHSNFVSAQWIGFQDPESDLSTFEWCIGKKQTQCDVLDMSSCFLSKNAFQSGLSLPLNTDLFVTVKAINNLGMEAFAISDSFRVDVTPPLLVRKPEFVLNDMQVSHAAGTQWEQSLARLQWKFEDSESSIVRHVLKLETHNDGRVEIESIELENDEKFTFQVLGKSRFKNGDTYVATVTSCNGAGLCSNASTGPLLIDGTPPHLGGFKQPLRWENGLTGSKISITWYGFVDVESSLDMFYVTVSTTYSGSDLSDGVLRFPLKHLQEQSEMANLNVNLTAGQNIILSIWARNKANLRSDIGKITVTAVANNKEGSKGFLDIQKHSCVSHFCNNDCTCAVVGKKCENNMSNLTCKEIPVNHTSVSNFTIEVFGGMGPTLQRLTASKTCLSGHWKIVAGNFDNIRRFEWSMGFELGKPGDGIFKGPSEPRWYDVGKELNVTYCLPYGRELQHGEKYVVYVKAWISSQEFFIFISPPITVDITPPQVGRGKYITESQEDNQSDIEFTRNCSYLAINWNRVFRESQSEIVKYELMAGTTPYGDDYLATTDYGMKTEVVLNNLDLFPGTRYYFTVRVMNSVGLVSALSSDGLVLDNEPPYSGIVYNTAQMHNIHFLSSLSDISSSWRGFGDHHSHLKEFIVELIDTQSGEVIDNETVSGLVSSFTFQEPNIVHNGTYIVQVRAKDMAGFESRVVEGPTVRVDTTPAFGFICTGFQQLNHTDVKFSLTLDNSSFSFDLQLQHNSYYKLKLRFSEGYEEESIYVKIGSHEMTIPVARNNDGTSGTEYNFLSPYDGDTNCELSAGSINRVVEASAKLLVCSGMNYSSSFSPIDLRQIGPSLLSVCTKAVDPESGIKSVLLGAGTTRGGFQIRAVAPVPTENHVTIHTDVPHGSPVFLTVILTNHAGLRSVFQPPFVVIDHTPPDLENVSGTLLLHQSDKYDTNGTGMVADMRVTWTSRDDESGIKDCFCGIGLEAGSTSYWGSQLSTEPGVCLLRSVFVKNGLALYPYVTCTNRVELSASSNGDSIVVSYEPPGSDKVEVTLIPLGDSLIRPMENINGGRVQANRSVLQAVWSGFADVTPIEQYECRIKEDGDTLIDFFSVGKHEAVTKTNLQLKNGVQYDLDVLAVNVGGVRSDVATATILADNRTPSLTGNAATVQLKAGKININWENVFDLNPLLEAVFEVRVGSREGHNDIIPRMETAANKAVVSHHKMEHNIWIYIRALYNTGMSTTYRGIITI